MPPKPEQFYEFDGVQFFPEAARFVRLHDKSQSFIRPKERDFLLALLKRAPEIVTYEELRREVWPETKNVEDALPTMRETKRSVDKLLKGLAHKPNGLIHTVIGQGYCLDSLVTKDPSADEQSVENSLPLQIEEFSTREVETFQPTESLQPAELMEVRFEGQEGSLPPEAETIQHPVRDEASLKDEAFPRPTLIVGEESARKSTSLFGGHSWHVLTSCALYALLYAVALLLEIAYRFDEFGATAVRLTPFVFLWILVTSLVGLAVDASRARQGRAKGLIVAVLCFISSALMLYFALCFFLPDFAVTESSHRAHTAQGSYLKNVLYFLPLGIIFVLLPFHFVISLQREMRSGRRRLVRDLLLGKRRSVAPGNAIYLKVWWLVLLLSGAAVLSLVFTMYLLDHLESGRYANLFTQLVFWRILLYFALGVECLIWYAQSLNALKRECLNTSDLNPQSQLLSSHSIRSDRSAL